MTKNTVAFANALEYIKEIEDGSIDLIILDPNYGVTKNEWDVETDMSLYWKDIWRVLRPTGKCLVFGIGKFSAKTILSDPNYKYTIIWKKTSPTGFLNAKKMILPIHEDIMVFSKKKGTYNPQKTTGHPRKVSTAAHKRNSVKTSNYNEHKLTTYDSTERYPVSVIEFKSDKQKEALHPTQKPVSLIEYLIRTFSNKGETILDLFAGSGTTGVAAMNTRRNYILVENNKESFTGLINRINNHEVNLYSFSVTGNEIVLSL